MTKEEREKRIEELRKEFFILENTRICENCGKEYLATNSNSKYCSSFCSHQAFRKANPDKVRKYNEKYARKRAFKEFKKEYDKKSDAIYYSTEKVVDDRLWAENGNHIPDLYI